MMKGPPHSLLSDMGTQNAGEKLKQYKITLSLYTAVLLKHFSISEKKHILSKYGWDGRQNPSRIPYFTFLANLKTNKFEEK